ncbi:methyl-accepting chemotaxis protein [Pseudomonas sp. PLB05]|uniref:methyl-accepting chemotaxis protein n=1 Tax=Pseudomonas sp. PLB05 TaxID=2899078 RepID=UPI001E642476|nr:methyl-accepting chemotaxis protein [Pseudomonas sp. PLB05]MCD4863523.1 methyl-accepting chemotaxis protein [Pseudomonas sp. PLB05]
MNLRQLRIAPRATLCFGAVTLFVMLLGAFALVQLKALRATEQAMEAEWLASVQTTDDIQVALLHTRLESIRLLASEDSVAMALATRQIQVNRDLMNARTAYYRDYLISTAEERSNFDQAALQMKGYLDGLDRVVTLAASDRAEALKLANGEQRQRAEGYQEQLTRLREFNGEGARQAGAAATGIYDRSVSIVVGIMLLAVLVTLLLAWRLTRSLAQPIGASLAVADAIAQGELTGKIDPSGRDEAAGLMRALAQMQDNLKDTLHGISGSSSRLSDTARTMHAVTDQASRALASQNAEIDQAATAVTEMSAAVEEVARNASSTSQAARESSAAAENGNAKVGQALHAMQRLTQQVQSTSVQVEGLAGQAQDISQVLSVIGSIAEQTNLLALNAAIEAARAGEQGRGFAVVADEVRALAHRTQTSTREIEQMIQAIQKGSAEAVDSMQLSTTQAQATYAVAQEAGAALSDILQAVRLIDERNLQIATASEEQAHVSREVDRNLISIRDLSVQTSDGNRETVGASEQLSELAGELQTLVRRFKLA